MLLISESISGSDTRSGFKKRSNRSSNLIGSKWVMPSNWQTSDPTAEPRPVPFAIPTGVVKPLSSFQARNASFSIGAFSISSGGILSYSAA